MMNVKTLTKERFLLQSFQPTLTVFAAAVASLFLATPSQAFSLLNSQGNIEFSAYNFGNGVGSPTFGTRVPGELLSPGRNYPLLTTPPVPPSQTKSGSLPLGDVWVDPRGSGNIGIETITFPTIAGISWSGNGVFLKDENTNDNLAVSNASYAQASFKTTVASNYERFVSMNVGGSIDLTKPDAWVAGSAIGEFVTPGSVIPFQFLFGFDGANRGREDFIAIAPANSSIIVQSISAGDSSFNVLGAAMYGNIFGLKEGDNITLKATFTCYAFNGQCGAPEIQFGQPVPEPLTMLGSAAAVGFVAAFNRRLAKVTKEKKDS
jgi:hypothetical protein